MRGTQAPSILHNSSERIRIGLAPLRSPLLRGSRLFSFPPLNDMLKFSGWSTAPQALKSFSFAVLSLKLCCGVACAPNVRTGTEARACSARALARTQAAFKVLVIRLILQCIRVIACRRVLHRLGSQDIHCYELFVPHFLGWVAPPEGDPFFSVNVTPKGTTFVMIQLQVHLQLPCYDFCFLY